MRWPLFRFVREPSRLKGRLLFKVFKSVDDLNSGLQLQRLSLNILLVFCLQVTSPNEFLKKITKSIDKSHQLAFYFPDAAVRVAICSVFFHLYKFIFETRDKALALCNILLLVGPCRNNLVVAGDLKGLLLFFDLTIRLL